MLHVRNVDGAMADFLAELGMRLVDDKTPPRAPTSEEERLIAAYRAGEISQESWQKHIRKNPDLAILAGN